MRSSYRSSTPSQAPTLDLRGLLVDLVEAKCEFVVIGSSALAMHGWKVSPSDLDVMAPPSGVERIATAIGVSPDQMNEVTDGEARRLECRTHKGPVDVYLEVSGGLSYESVRADAVTILLGQGHLDVPVGSVEDVRDMRAAVGRAEFPPEAILPAQRPGAPKVVAIDGPAGAGKSTISRMVARRLGFTYLNTGAMYRCVTLAVLESSADTDDHSEIARIASEAEIEFRGDRVFLGDRDVSDVIRTDEVTTATPHIAAYPEVRAAMVMQQRSLFGRGGYVAEGRDTGTVVAPEAPLKVYLTASPEERARRRSLETGEDQKVVQGALEERDRLDAERKLSALRVADDAVVVDTTQRSIDEVVDEVEALARERGVV